MPRTQLTDVQVAIAGARQPSSTTIGAVGAYSVVVATVLPDRAITLTSSYLSAMVGDIAASHLCSAPGEESPRIEQRVLPGQQPGETHARSCLLDHAAELQAKLTEFTDDAVSIDIGATALSGCRPRLDSPRHALTGAPAAWGREAAPRA